MLTPNVSVFSARGWIAGLTALVLLFLTQPAVSLGQVKIIDKEASARGRSGRAANFVAVKGAKDCVYDHVRKRLYVTTLSQLVVVDMTIRKVIESIDLLGSVQGLDISAKAKFLAIAPIAAQYIYKVDLDWKSAEDMKVERIKFKADSNETGVFSVGIGADDSILFTTTFSGSGRCQAPPDGPTGAVSDIARFNMDSIIAITGDRQKAYIAEGNSKSGPLDRFNFRKKLSAK